jgi:hypothetical protein
MKSIDAAAAQARLDELLEEAPHRPIVTTRELRFRYGRPILPGQPWNDVWFTK